MSSSNLRKRTTAIISEQIRLSAIKLRFVRPLTHLRLQEVPVAVGPHGGERYTLPLLPCPRHHRHEVLVAGQEHLDKNNKMVPIADAARGKITASFWCSCLFSYNHFVRFEACTFMYAHRTQQALLSLYASVYCICIPPNRKLPARWHSGASQPPKQCPRTSPARPRFATYELPCWPPACLGTW